MLFLNYDSIGLKSDAKPVPGVPTDSVRGDLNMDIFTAAVGYRFDTFGDKNWIDVLVGERQVGARYENSARGLFPASVQNNDDISDTVIVLRPSFRFAEKWRFNPTFDYGVSGDSDTTYTLSPQVQWDFSDSFAMRFGFKKVNYQWNKGVNGTANYRELNIDTEGPFVGLGWMFPSRKKPAPVRRSPRRRRSRHRRRL